MGIVDVTGLATDGREAVPVETVEELVAANMGLLDKDDSITKY